MHVISVRNVSAALVQGLDYLLHSGVREETRVGPALVSPVPVTTVYSKPRERVLLSDVRDANPFFHLAEAMWMLDGRRDAAFLNNFIPDFGERFAESDGNVHGAYGNRWRHRFSQLRVNPDGSSQDPNGNGFVKMDQLTECVAELKSNPTSRQVVLTMWDPTIDLAVSGLKDRPCNTHVYFRVQDTGAYRDPPVTDQNSAEHEARISRGNNLVLDMTVLCRSNDIIMGAYGANAVHFTILQEYVAAKVGVRVGTYYQVSNNFHAYQRDLDMLDKRVHKMGGHFDTATECKERSYEDRRVYPARLVDNPATFDGELNWLLTAYEATMKSDIVDDDIAHHAGDLGNKFLALTVWPMLMAHRGYRLGKFGDANWWANSIEAPDWRKASRDWVERRERAALRKEGVT